MKTCMMMKSGLVTLTLALTLATLARANVLSQVFCSCDNCCAKVQELDFTVSEVIEIDSKNALKWTRDKLTYDTVTALRVVDRLTHYDLIATQDANCGSSLAFVANEAGTMEPQTVQLEQVNPTTCRANWNGMFATTGSYASFNDIIVFFAFKKLEATKVFVVPDLDTNIITQYDLDRPLFVTDLFGPVLENNVWSLRVLVRYFEARDAGDCPFPNQVVAKLGDCAPYVFKKTASSSSSAALYEYTPERADFEICATERVEMQDQIVYTLPLAIQRDQIVLEPTCDVSRKFLTYEETEFYMAVEVGLESSTSIRDISNVRTTLAEVGVHKPCNGLFSPQAEMFITFETRVSDAQFEGFTPQETIFLEDTTFELDKTSLKCTSSGLERLCTYTYFSVTCVLMTNRYDLDEVRCSFENLGEIRNNVYYSRMGGTLSKLYPFSDSIPNLEFTNCATPADLVTFNSEFPVQVLAQNLGGMNEPILVEMRFLDPLMDKSSATTFKISKVVVTHKSISREFQVDTKIALMGSDSSPYHEDGHFCRFEPENSQTCEPFYSVFENLATRSNDKSYGVPGKGFFLCQDINTRNVDRFIFTPNKWSAFEQLVVETSVELNIQVFATLDTCLPSNSATSRRQRRVLGDGAVFKILAANTTLIVEKQEPDSAPVPVFVIVIAVLSSLLCCCGSVILLFWFRTRRRSKSDCSKNNSDALAVVSIQV